MRVGGRTGLVAILGAVTLSVVAVGAGGTARAASSPNRYRADDYADGQAMYVLPPGENGLVNATDALQFETTGKRPAASDDQLSQYSNLLYGAPTLTNANLTDYFNDESFGVKPEDVTKTETPGPGVTIYRDKHDVPHIYGDTNPAAAFGAGYAQAEDRLFMMDVLRHYGAGTLASFLGASCDFEQMDHDQLLLSPYTPAQAQAQVDALPKRYGEDGALAKSMIDAYVQGVNAYIDATKTDPSKLPADYVAAAPDQLLPKKWTDADVVSIAGLIGGIFGKGGGFEVNDAHLLTYLQNRLGNADGLRAYHEVDHQNDPLAPTTITDKTFPYDVRTKPWDQSLNALPDDGALTGGPQGTAPGCGDGSSPAPPAVPGIPLSATTQGPGSEEHHRLAEGHAEGHEQRARGQRLADQVGPPDRGVRPAGVLLRAADPQRPRHPRARLRRHGRVVPGHRPGRARTRQGLRLVGDLRGERPDRPAGGEDLQPLGRYAGGERHVVPLQRHVPPDAARGVRRDGAAEGERHRCARPAQAHDLQDQPRHRAGLDHGQGQAGRDRDPAVDVQPRHRLRRRLPRLR